MKKSTLLSLLTAASIVLTSAGTYAAWDKVTNKTSASVDFRKPVTVEVTSGISLSTTGTMGKDPVASGDVTFTVATGDKQAKKLKLVPEVKGAAGVDASKFNFVISGGDSIAQIDSESSNGFTDTLSNDGPKTYTVKATPKDGLSAEEKGNISKQSVSITLNAELTAN